MEYQKFIKSSEVNTDKIPKVLKQYLDIKRQNADTVLFFRLGDFYETYFEDAVILSKVCGVLLTKRKFQGAGDIPMAGVPFLNAEVYISKLVKEKYRVSVAEQVQDKCDLKRGEILKREIIRTYSPGMLIDEKFLDAKENNFIAAVLKEGARYGFSYADISTGEFFITEGNLEEILCELSKVDPKELLLKIQTREIEPMKAIPDEAPDIDECIAKKYPYTLIKKDFYSLDVQNKSLLEYQAGLKCANAIINYAKITQKNFMPKLDVIKKYSIATRLVMNLRTRENLEINKNLSDGKRYGSLVWAQDKCKTVMGKRLLASFLNEPLYNVEEIEKRLDGVEELVSKQKEREELDKIFENTADISRLSSKLSNGTITPKEFLAIKDTLKIAEQFYNVCAHFKANILQAGEKNEILINFREIIERTVKDEPSNNIRVGNIIKEGANGNLDVIRNQISNLEEELLKYETELVSKTGIKNLKINYAKNTGYSIDVPLTASSAFAGAINDFIRKQKLASVEKFSTKRLGEFEEKILGLKLKGYELEYDTFLKLREYAKEITDPLREFSSDIALKDVLLAFSKNAVENNYVRPKFSKNDVYCVKKGCHPVLLELSKSGDRSCDCMDIGFSEREKVKILTGANMSGKSTYLKEAGVLIILAQSGSFVPAESYEASLADKIFARMGSSDDLLNGSSAFMCEMLDVAEILRNSTAKSLILLDETGKSTSYRDGISLSYGIIKYILKEIGAKTILATHFSDLKTITEEEDRVCNYKLCMIDDGKCNVTRVLKKGVCEDSSGFETAKRAGMPDFVLESAQGFRAAKVNG